jgi:hypothetical protein
LAQLVQNFGVSAGGGLTPKPPPSVRHWSQFSKVNPKGPKTPQPTRDCSVNFTVCTANHFALGMNVYCSKYGKRTNVEYETRDDVLLRACASVPYFLVRPPKADILRRIADRTFSRKAGMLATERPKYPDNVSKRYT